MKIKFDNRFKEVTECGKTRKHKKVYKVNIDYKRRRLNFVFGLLMIIIVGGLILNYTNRPVETVKAQEVSVQLRDVQPRETAREVEKTPEKAIEKHLTGKYGETFEKYFGYKDGRIIQAICNSESQWNSWAVNDTLNADKTWDVGLCQINVDVHGYMVNGSTKQEKVESLKNPEYNISIAKKVYDNRSKWDTSGFKAWSDFNNGKYLKYLPVDK